MSQSVSYSNHIGTNGRNGGKSNSISNTSDLKDAEKHANHNYTKKEVEKMESNIDLDKRHLNRLFECHNGELVELTGPNKYLELERLVKEAYHHNFDGAISEYNQQMKETAKHKKIINDYLTYMSKNRKMQIVSEGILQIGDHDTWNGKSDGMRRKASDLLISLLKITVDMINEKSEGEFVLIAAAIHMNETCPHCHYWGLCIEYGKKKNKPSTRISKSAVFNKETLALMQTEIRDYAQALVHKEFGWSFNTKRKGRNKDYTKTQLLFIKEQQAKRIEKAKLINRANSVGKSIHPLHKKPKTDTDDSSCLAIEYTISLIIKSSDSKTEATPQDEKSNNNSNVFQAILDRLFNLFILNKRKQKEEEEEEIRRKEREQELQKGLQAENTTNEYLSNELSKPKYINLDEIIFATKERTLNTPRSKDKVINHENER